MRALALLAVALPAAGCRLAGVGYLRPTGARVAVVDERPGQECERLGRVAVEAEKLYVRRGSSELALDHGVDLLRNAAAERGADAVLVEPPQLHASGDGDTLLVTGLAFRCAAPPLLPDGRPAPEGAFVAVLRFTTSARSGPHPKASGLVSVEAGTRVVASGQASNGFRRILTEDGRPLGFVEDRALDAVRR